METNFIEPQEQFIEPDAGTVRLNWIWGKLHLIFKDLKNYTKLDTGTITVNLSLD